MEVLIFKKNIDGHYSAYNLIQNFNESHVQLLCYFLPEILNKQEIHHLQEWAKNTKDLSTPGGNEFWLDKNKKNIVLSVPVLDLGIEFTITIESFINLLHDWYNLISQDAQQIVIHYDEKKYTVFVSTE